MRPRRATGVILVWRPAGSRPRKSQWFSLNPRAGKRQCLSLKTVRQEEFSPTWRRVNLSVLFKTSADWIRPTHIRGGTIYFTLSTDFNVNITPKQPHRIPSVWAPWARSSWYIKLTVRPGMWASQSGCSQQHFSRTKRWFSCSSNRVYLLQISHCNRSTAEFMVYRIIILYLLTGTHGTYKSLLEYALSYVILVFLQWRYSYPYFIDIKTKVYRSWVVCPSSYSITRLETCSLASQTIFLITMLYHNFHTLFNIFISNED